MRKGDRIFREILYRVYEQGELFMSQKSLARACGVSIGMVNLVIKKLERFGCIEKKPLGLRVTDPRKILLYWASKRDLTKDIVYKTHVPSRISRLEADLSQDSILTAYSGFRARFGSTPGDYDEVYVYADPEQMKRSFKPAPTQHPNLCVLRADEHLKRLSRDGIAPLPQLYVDFWQLGRTANRFVEELERKLESVQVGAFKAMLERVRKISKI